MGWIAYVIAWLAAALFWALAAASTANLSPLATLPFGLLVMASAALMGVGVWRLTEHVAWRSPRFYVIHPIAMIVFSVGYTLSSIVPDIIKGRALQGLAALRASPVLFWSLLMGSWLYVIVAGLSYAIRAQRRIQAQEAAAAEARLLAQQAQLVALRAQINPHFLFNALHSVGALVTSDPRRADEALERLGDLLRYALGNEAEVPFAHEWRFTQDYLAFEQLRLGDRLRVDVDADLAAMPVMVPPLILQPLVENAVRHGIAERPDGGCIDVHARVQDSQLILRVRDDGNGAAAVAGDGVGLGSVRRRLAALYGSRATLDVDRTAGFTITIGLPFEPADDLGSAA